MIHFLLLLPLFVHAQSLVRQYQEEKIGDTCPTYREFRQYDVSILKVIPSQGTLARSFVLPDDLIAQTYRLQDHYAGRMRDGESLPLEGRILTTFYATGDLKKNYYYPAKTNGQYAIGDSYSSLSPNKGFFVTIQAVTQYVGDESRDTKSVYVINLKYAQSKEVLTSPYLAKNAPRYAFISDNQEVLVVGEDNSTRLYVEEKDANGVKKFVVQKATLPTTLSWRDITGFSREGGDFFFETDKGQIEVVQGLVKSAPENVAMEERDYTGVQIKNVRTTVNNMTEETGEKELTIRELGMEIGKLNLKGCTPKNAVMEEDYKVVLTCEEGVYFLQLNKEKPLTELTSKVIGFLPCL